MSNVILDINDATLSLWSDSQRTLQSPGYALLEGRSYNFGEDARSKARLRPQQINHRFWSQLDTEALSPAFGPGRHSADLVHAHLLSIHEQGGRPDELIIAAPGSLQHDQLALLLGIIEQCPFTVVGLVDRAVAAAAQVDTQAYNWHVELQLHQALVTGIRSENGSLARDKVTPIPGSGWLAVQDSLARAIADAFIRQTRFDPRRQAATEQTLYDRLPALLAALQNSTEHNMELGGHHARIERSLLAESCENHYQRIRRSLEDQSGQLLLGPGMAHLPALTQQLPQAQVVAPEAIPDSVRQYRDNISQADGGVHFITSLPARTAAPAPSPQPAAPVEAPPVEAAPVEAPAAPPTHCQIDIKDKALTLTPQSGPAPRVNGEAISSSKSLLAGDVIELDNGTAWKLVEVQADDGSQT
jgi:hypothetical protein